MGALEACPESSLDAVLGADQVATGVYDAHRDGSQAGDGGRAAVGAMRDDSE